MKCFLAILIVFYIWNALTYFKLGKKFDVESSWLAWIPYGCFYVAIKLAKSSLLEIVIPFGLVFFSLRFTERAPILLTLVLLWIWMIALDMKILKRLHRKPSLALLRLVPFGQVILLLTYSIEAFGYKNEAISV